MLLKEMPPWTPGDYFNETKQSGRRSKSFYKVKNKCFYAFAVNKSAVRASRFFMDIPVFQNHG